MKRQCCIIIRSNTLDRDVRVPKEICVLREEFDLVFLGWNRDRTQLNSNSEFREVIFDFHAPYGKLSPIFLPIWWIFVFFWLMRNKCDIVHCINLDSAIPAILASKIKQKKFVYEILDTYEDSLILPHWLRNMLIRLDKYIISFSDAIILVDAAQLDEFNGIKNKNIAIIYDSPPDIVFEDNGNGECRDIFTLFYAGNFSKDRHLNLDKLVSAISDINQVELIIAGSGDLAEIYNFQLQMPDKVRFIGRISYRESLRFCKDSDLLFVLRDPIVPINKYICGSTLLNAMMCGKPIIVNEGTSTSQKVLEEKCGLVLNANNIEEIKKAIAKLRDNPTLCKNFGINARRAYEERYGWHLMGQQLLDLYLRLH